MFCDDTLQRIINSRQEGVKEYASFADSWPFGFIYNLDFLSEAATIAATATTTIYLNKVNKKVVVESFI